MKQKRENHSSRDKVSALGDVHARRGRQAFNACDYSTAVEEYQLALQINTSDPAEVCLFLGLSFDKLGERDRAIESFEKGLENVHFDACRFDEARHRPGV